MGDGPIEPAARDDATDDRTLGPIEAWRAWFRLSFGWRSDEFKMLAVGATALATGAVMTGAYALLGRAALDRFGASTLPHILGGGRLADAAVIGASALAMLPVALGFGAWAHASCARLRRWTAQAPFHTRGWSSLARALPETARASWCPCEVEVRLAAPEASGYRDDGRATMAVDDAVHAALTTFAARANAHYAAVSVEGDDPRVSWTVDGIFAAGSANAAVVHELYRCLTGELTAVAQRHPRVRDVAIRHGAFVYLSPPSTD